MLALLAIFLLMITPLAMWLAHLTRLKVKYQRLIAAAGVALAWLLVLLSRSEAAYTVSIMNWQPEPLFPVSPALLVDNTSWLYGMALATLCISLALTATARLGGVRQEAPENWRTWSGNMALISLGLVAVYAANPLTMLLAWAAMDIIELLVLLGQTIQSLRRERIVMAFSARLASTAMLLLAGVMLWSGGNLLEFGAITPEVGAYFVLAAGLRLGVLPLNMPYLQEAPLSRALGTTLRLVPAASGLILLTRTATAGVASTVEPYLLAFLALAAIYSGRRWLASADELHGRPYWVIGSASLAAAAALRGMPQASLAWGLVCLFSGSLLFTASLRHRYLVPLLVFGMVGLSAFPFTPAWYGTQLFTPPEATTPIATLTSAYFFMLVFLIAHALLLAGYLRHALRPQEQAGTEETTPVERWVWLIYPLGLAFLLLTHLGLTWGLRPATQGLPITAWIEGALALGLGALFWGISLRQIPAQAAQTAAGQLTTGWLATVWERVASLNWFYRILWVLFRMVASLLSILSNVLEGEGGILWAFVLMVLMMVLSLK